MEDPRPGTRPLAETVLGRLGIELVDATANRVEVRMPVTPSVLAPDGLLQASIPLVLAETCASTGAGIAAGEDGRAFGIEIDGQLHHRPSTGTLHTVGEPVLDAPDRHTWLIRITDQDRAPVATSTCTLALRRVNSRASTS